MNVADFDYDLPPASIAQWPVSRRDSSRLLVLGRSDGACEHRSFRELGALLNPGDLLVLNNTRVRPCRLIGRKPTGGRVELLLVEPLERESAVATWRCLIQASRRPEPGSRIDFQEGLHAQVVDREAESFKVRLVAPGGDLEGLLDKLGRMPLPPYIRRPAGEPAQVDDGERYQTVFAERPGAIAAPTAGLHFTHELLRSLNAQGIEQAFLTLHVGPGTFLPVRAQQIEHHRLQAEWFETPPQLSAAIEATRARKGRVVAVGTTVVRALESSAGIGGRVIPQSGRSALFIHPGFQFQVVDALLTNFHLPRSTLLMLVSAFAGRERVLAAYREAIARGYRFYSYGDAMLVQP